MQNSILQLQKVFEGKSGLFYDFSNKATVQIAGMKRNTGSASSERVKEFYMTAFLILYFKSCFEQAP